MSVGLSSTVERMNVDSQYSPEVSKRFAKRATFDEGRQSLQVQVLVIFEWVSVGLEHVLIGFEQVLSQCYSVLLVSDSAVIKERSAGSEHHVTSC